MWFNGEDRKVLRELTAYLREQLTKDIREVLGYAKLHGPKELELSDKIVTLKNRIVELEIKESKITETHQKEERELKHMIGLEKKRQEFEIQQARKETAVGVREENLAADKKRFEDQMAFHNARFEEEVKYLKEIMGQILKRLPDVSAALNIGKASDGSRRK